MIQSKEEIDYPLASIGSVLDTLFWFGPCWVPLLEMSNWRIQPLQSFRKVKNIFLFSMQYNFLKYFQLILTKHLKRQKFPFGDRFRVRTSDPRLWLGWIPTILRIFLNARISLSYKVHMIENIGAFKIYLFLIEYFRIFVNKIEFEIVFWWKLLAEVRRKDGIAIIRFLTFFRVEWAIWPTTAGRGDTCFIRKTVENTDFAWVKIA